jgi:uncharacterized protein (TIGR02444 family)
MDEDFSIDGPLWQFALAFYGREGVATACLKLQELAGADVNILIFSIYAATHRHCLLETADLSKVDAIVRPWRSDVVMALRRIRIRLRTGPSPAPNPETEVLRNQIKAAELHAERIELAVLSQWLESEKLATNPSIDLAYALRTAVDFFASREIDASMHDAEIKAAIRVLVLAAGAK